MARSLLAPTAFLTLLGLAPGGFRAEASPEVAAASGAETTDVPAAQPEAAEPAGLVAYATTRSGNARAPSYDDAMMESKEPPNYVEVFDGEEPVAAQGVVVGFESPLDLPQAANP